MTESSRLKARAATLKKPTVKDFLTVQGGDMLTGKLSKDRDQLKALCTIYGGKAKLKDVMQREAEKLGERFRTA